MRKGNRYVARAPGHGGMKPGDYIQIGVGEGVDFDPDIVEFSWGETNGIAVLRDGVIGWPDGRASETSYDPQHPTQVLTVHWQGERTVWHLEGEPVAPVAYQAVEDIMIESDRSRRVVVVTMGTLRLTMSPEAADKLSSRVRYHADRARER